MYIHTNTHHVKNIGIPHTYAYIHEYKLTQHMNNIGTYTTHAHSRERVLAGIHHTYNKYTLSHTLCTQQTKQIQRHRHILTHTQKNNTL